MLILTQSQVKIIINYEITKYYVIDSFKYNFVTKYQNARLIELSRIYVNL